MTRPLRRLTRHGVALLLAAVIAGLVLALYTPDSPRAALAARYQRDAADRVAVAGTVLHVRDDGPRDAPAFLLLHGFGASLHTWEPWAEQLSDRFRVVRVDLPGFGLSDPDPAGDYGDERGTAVLVALLDHLGIERATLIGNSLGGRLAWRLAAAYPARVTGLVLIAPDGFASPGFDYGRPAEVPASLQLMRYALPAMLVRLGIEPAYADPARLSAEVVQRYRDLMLAPGIRSAMLERLAGTVLVPPAPLLARVTAPTLLVWGERDQMIPVHNARDYLAALPGAQLVTFPALGHVPHEEAPAESLAAVRDFLVAVGWGTAPRLTRAEPGWCDRAAARPAAALPAAGVGFPPETRTRFIGGGRRGGLGLPQSGCRSPRHGFRSAGCRGRPRARRRRCRRGARAPRPCAGGRAG